MDLMKSKHQRSGCSTISTKPWNRFGKRDQIITHLRTFGRAAPASREPVSVKTILAQALSLLQEQLRLRSIEIRLHLCSEDPIVMGSAIQLEQVFINLLTNARDAVSHASVKQIIVRSVADAHCVTVTVQDSGPGIPPGLEQRIFDPFFSTKDVGAGTGLGLSITYGILKDHQGSITVESRSGVGATFVVSLPLVGKEKHPKAGLP